VLYQLSYAPGSAGIVSAHSGDSGRQDRSERDDEDAETEYYAARVQRHALGFLFGTLAVVFAGTAVAAFVGAGDSPKGWVVAAAALALAAWLGSLAVAAFRGR
jgi:fructose-1,6-bisphosphatase/sedoheptulose 1,7-bisphosphatase-like protein